jgi:hypothetical protein
MNSSGRELLLVYMCAYTKSWRSSGILEKGQATLTSTGYVFADAALVFEDPVAITIVDDESNPIEQRYVILVADPPGGYWWSSTLGAGTISG